MAFLHPGLSFAPLSTPGLSILSVLAYMTGAADFNGVFALSEGLGKSSVPIPFLPISIMLWITFVFVMVVLLINMLVRYHNNLMYYGNFRHFHECMSLVKIFSAKNFT